MKLARGHLAHRSGPVDLAHVNDLDRVWASVVVVVGSEEGGGHGLKGGGGGRRGTDGRRLGPILWQAAAPEGRTEEEEEVLPSAVLGRQDAVEIEAEDGVENGIEKHHAAILGREAA